MAVPPVVVWTVGMIGVGIIVRLIVKEWRRANEELARARTVRVATALDEAIPQLQRDPVTGIYRP